MTLPGTSSCKHNPEQSWLLRVVAFFVVAALEFCYFSVVHLSMIHPDLLAILVCPESRQELREASTQEVNALNEQIRDGIALYSGGNPVTEPIDGLLIRSDGTKGYAIRDDIPVMVMDMAIRLNLGALLARSS